MTKTLQKNIRVLPEQWNRIETAAKKHDASANQLVVDLALEALDRREWPRTDQEIRMLRSCLFTAQVLARELIDTGREEELAEIRRHVSQMAPELPGEPSGTDA